MSNALLNEWAKDQGVEMEAEKQIADDLEIDDQEQQQKQQQEQQLEAANDPQYTPTEKKALEMGWRPKDEWNGNEEEWTNAKDFVKFGEVMEANKKLHSKIDHLQNDFSHRIDNLKQFHEQNLQTQIEALKSKRDQAASEADMETYRATNKQIDDLSKAPQPANDPQINDTEFVKNIIQHPNTQQFIRENPWIEQNGAKGVYGQKVFADWINTNINNPNAILEDGLKMVTDKVNNEFPPQNPKRNTNVQMGDKGNGPKKGPVKNRLTMDDLTRDELNIWNSMGGSWKSQDEFLQTVADFRKGD